MALSKRHKYVLTMLAIYWPVIFIATHIPVPGLVRQSGMSDKTMHFLAYLVLVFLWWFTISPRQRVDWKKTKVWLTLALMVWYGAFDEWLQHYVGRSANVLDFYADLAGALAGLAILTVFSFWPAALLISAVFIFAVSNLSKIDMLWQQPSVNICFHFIGYAVFSLIWIQLIYRHIKVEPNKLVQPKWLLIAFSAPLALLVATKAGSIIFGKTIWPIDCVVALTGITAAVIISYLTIRKNSKRLG